MLGLLIPTLNFSVSLANNSSLMLCPSKFGEPVGPHLHIDKWPAGGNETMTAALDDCDWWVWHLYPESADWRQPPEGGESAYMRVMTKLRGNEDIGFAYHLQFIDA